MVGKSISGGPILYLASLVVFIILYVCFLRKKQLTIYRKLIFITLYVYLVLVIEKTLMPIPINYTMIEMWRGGFALYATEDYFNLFPYFDFSNNLWLRNMILNIIMFMPFGILLPLYKGKFHLKYIFISSLIFSSMIELYQLCMAFTMGTPYWYFDTNDLIANVLGGLFGYLILVLISPYVFKRISKKEIYGEEYESKRKKT